MPKPKVPSPHAGRAVLSFTAAGHSWSVSTPLMNASPRSMSAALTDLLQALCRKAEPDLHPKAAKRAA